MGSKIKRRGLMLVLSSPSGAGKTTISRQLLDREPDLTLSISCTTRAPRVSEVDGVDYHFIGDEVFREMVVQDAFLEHAEVHDHRYGTPAQAVKDDLSAGRDVLFDIDWQGTQQVMSKLPNDLVRVFVLPPSGPDLESRLHGRAQDSEAVIHRRLGKAAEELTHYAEYDYIVINRDVEESVLAVQRILAAERLKRERQLGLDDFVQELKAFCRRFQGET